MLLLCRNKKRFYQHELFELEYIKEQLIIKHICTVKDLEIKPQWVYLFFYIFFPHIRQSKSLLIK